MKTLVKEPLAWLGTAVAVTGIAVSWKNSFPSSSTCFQFGKPTPQEEAACADEKGRRTVGYVLTGIGLATLLAAAIKQA